MNSINIARLYRRKDEMDRAMKYSELAFATTAGARSTSDAMYRNITLARLHSARGCHMEAFVCWMRAGLHWAASEAPEAVSRRVLDAMTGGKTCALVDVPEITAESLFSLIFEAATRSGILSVIRHLESFKPDGPPAPVFVSSGWFAELLPASRFEWAVLANGISFLATRVLIPPQITGPSSQRLNVLLYRILLAISPADSLAGMGVVAVDDVFGLEMPSVGHDLLAAAFRLDIPTVWLGETKISLDSLKCAVIQRNLRVSVGSAVERIVFFEGGAVVFFKRYLQPAILSPGESQTIRGVEASPWFYELVQRLSVDSSWNIGMQTLRRLEKMRVIHVSLDSIPEFPV